MAALAAAISYLRKVRKIPIEGASAHKKMAAEAAAISFKSGSRKNA
jgi:hypothetical protein